MSFGVFSPRVFSKWKNSRPTHQLPDSVSDVIPHWYSAVWVMKGVAPRGGDERPRTSADIDSLRRLAGLGSPSGGLRLQNGRDSTSSFRALSQATNWA